SITVVGIFIEEKVAEKLDVAAFQRFQGRSAFTVVISFDYSEALEAESGTANSALRMPVKLQYQSIRSPVQDSEYTNPRPKAQERERGDRRMAREDDRRRRYRKNFKTQRGRLCLRKAIGHRMETPIRNLDHSSHFHRGLRKSSSTPVHQKKLTCLSCQCSGQCPGTESPPRVVAPHQWGGSRKGIRHRFLAEIDWEEDAQASCWWMTLDMGEKTWSGNTEEGRFCECEGRITVIQRVTTPG
ncbi:hypothetical protein ARMGADRAFT_1018126, partial [Armillaria gallica]